MKPLKYYRPTTLDEALKLKAEHGNTMKVYAGGTDIMVQLREDSRRMADMESFLDLNAVPGLKRIELREKTIWIGALTTHSEVHYSPIIQEHAAFLSEACSTVGSEQIRNVGTIGGNICNASPAADSPSASVALDAILHVASVRGTRKLPIEEAYVKSGVLALEADEIVTAIEFPRIDEYKTAFIKLGRRKALAISRMNMACAMKVENGVIADCHLVPGCVFSTPCRVRRVEEFVIGKEPTQELFLEAGKIASEVMIEKTGVRWSTEYKQPVVEALTTQALCRAAGISEE